MSRVDLCPRCGQPLPPKNREGVYLPAKKAAIYDFIRQHPGIMAEGIRAQCFSDKTPLTTIRVHVSQINELMAGTDVQIRGERLGGKDHGGYRIVKKAAIKRWRKAKRR